MIDRACSLALLAAAALLVLAYLARALRLGAARYERVTRDRGSRLFGTAAMHVGYWGLIPLGRACARAGISAAGVTWGSLVLGVLAGIALAAGHFGVGAVLACAAALGDSLDGIVAREAGEASEAGEVLDAAADRYSESAFLVGVLFAERNRPVVLLIVAVGLVGAFMVSYATAKAEAHRVTPPRGAMRRPERALYLILGATLTPVLGPWLVRLGGAPMRDMPMIVAVALVGVVSNVSAVRRLSAVARGVAGRASGSAPGLSADATRGTAPASPSYSGGHPSPAKESA